MDRFTQSWLARSASWLVPKEYESAIKENSQQHIQETLQHYEYSKLLEFLQNQIEKNADGIANISMNKKLSGLKLHIRLINSLKTQV